MLSWNFPMKNELACTIFSLSPEETFRIGKSFGSRLKGGELIILEGDLGMGKTVMAKGIASALGIDPDDVSSPSFTIINEHRGKLLFIHIDLYRINNDEEVEALGIRDILELNAVVAVEWGEKLPSFYRKNGITITILDMGEDSRKITIS